VHSTKLQAASLIYHSHIIETVSDS